MWRAGFAKPVLSQFVACTFCMYRLYLEYIIAFSQGRCREGVKVSDMSVSSEAGYKDATDKAGVVGMAGKVWKL